MSGQDAREQDRRQKIGGVTQSELAEKGFVAGTQGGLMAGKPEARKRFIDKRYTDAEIARLGIGGTRPVIRANTAKAKLKQTRTTDKTKIRASVYTGTNDNLA